MTKIDLVTGFLGAGKTTFIYHYVDYLLKQGKKVGIIENDFGPINVDMMLLREHFGDRCQLEMVAGDKDHATYQRRFKTKLIALGMQNFDVILVEPSGLFDVDDFFDLLYEQPLNSWYQIGNVFTLVEANLDENLSKNSRYILASEIANAGIVLVTKCEKQTDMQFQKLKKYLNKALKENKCPRELDLDLRMIDYNKMDANKWNELSHCGYHSYPYMKRGINLSSNYQSYFFMNLNLTLEKVKALIETLFTSSHEGTPYRIKGFVLEDNKWYEYNATKEECLIQPILVGQDLMIIIGENLKQEEIEKIIR